MTITFDLIQTIGLAVIFLLLGSKVKERLTILQKYFIPAPVVGGILFSIITFIGHQTGSFSVTLNGGMNNFLMVMFFTCTGFLASMSVIKKSGRLGLLLAAVAVLMLFFQNFLGAGLASLFGLHPLLGVSMGSISMSSGIGSAVAFGPTFEEYGVPNATLVGIAAATFGLVMGSLVGGPVAKRLIDRYKLTSSGDQGENLQLEEKETTPSTPKSVTNSVWIVLLTMMAGGYLVGLLNKTGITFPYYVGGVFTAAIFRNIADSMKIHLRMKEIDTIGNISLSLFLTLSLMNLKVWELLSLAVLMLVILGAQSVFMAVYAYYVTFRAMGKDYEAAVMAAGHVGVGLGQTPNAVANMATIIDKFGPAPNAWLMLPVITVIFINICNPFVITLFMNYLK